MVGAQRLVFDLVEQYATSLYASRPVVAGRAVLRRSIMTFRRSVLVFS